MTDIHPTYPEVRCASCGLVYTLPPPPPPLIVVVGNCPRCGHVRFHTVLTPEPRP